MVDAKIYLQIGILMGAQELWKLISFFRGGNVRVRAISEDALTKESFSAH